MFGGVDLFKIKVWKKNAFWKLANVLKEAVP
jgi:hypothetical protein